MIDRRTKNAEIFRDTERRYTTDQALIQAVRQSTEAQVFIAEKATVDVLAPRRTENAKVIVSGKRSLEAAESYAKQGKTVCVLNFASATNPGGGVVNGSSAQEECICRCTTLYPCLNSDQMWNAFYKLHRKTANPLYNNDCIYTPDVCVFKSDTNFPKPLPNYKLRGKERARFKEMLEDLLSAVPDTLTVDEVAELTGYSRKTILRYAQRKYIYAVNIMGKCYISKQSIINYLATDKAFKNTQKSEWHEDIILKIKTIEHINF